MSEKWGCFVDDHHGSPCVFDELPYSIHDCTVATRLLRGGFGRSECKYWRKLPSVSENETFLEYDRLNSLVNEKDAEIADANKECDELQSQIHTLTIDRDDLSKVALERLDEIERLRCESVVMEYHCRGLIDEIKSNEAELTRLKAGERELLEEYERFTFYRDSGQLVGTWEHYLNQYANRRIDDFLASREQKGEKGLPDHPSTRDEKDQDRFQE